MADIKNKSSSWTTVIITVIALAFGALYLNKCNENKTSSKETINLINALNDSVKYYKNKDSSNTAQIAVITNISTKSFLELKTKDSTITKLQGIVKDYSGKLKHGGSVTSGDIITVYTDTGKSIITKIDTVGKFVYETYRQFKHDNWIDYDAVMSHGSSSYKIAIKNSFSVVLGTKNGVPFADLTTENPYTTTKTIRSFQVTLPKQKKFGLGFFLGGTYVADKWRPVIGGGITYTPIHF